MSTRLILRKNLREVSRRMRERICRGLLAQSLNNPTHKDQVRHITGGLLIGLGLTAAFAENQRKQARPPGARAPESIVSPPIWKSDKLTGLKTGYVEVDGSTDKTRLKKTIRRSKLTETIFTPLYEHCVSGRNV